MFLWKDADADTDFNNRALMVDQYPQSLDVCTVFKYRSTIYEKRTSMLLNITIFLFTNLIEYFKWFVSALLSEGELRALMVPPCESEVEAVYGTS